MPQHNESTPSQIAPSLAHPLASLVGVSPGAVVSRTIAKSKAGTITLFAFDDGEGISEHAAPFDAFVQVIDGKMVLTIGGKAVVAEAGTITRMPADVHHALRAQGPTRMLLVMIREPHEKA